MINPTDENYSFEWYEVKKHPATTVSPFSCSKHSGHLQSRKEMEVSLILALFEFFVDTVSINSIKYEGMCSMF